MHSAFLGKRTRGEQSSLHDVDGEASMFRWASGFVQHREWHRDLLNITFFRTSSSMGWWGCELFNTVVNTISVDKGAGCISVFEVLPSRQHHGGLIFLSAAAVTRIDLSLATVIIRRIYFHPLAAFPDPVLGKFTHLPILLAVAKRYRTLELFSSMSSCRNTGVLAG